MEMTGQCYCGQVKYRATGDPIFKGQCHCRECQYISGGYPNAVIGISETGFEYTSGETRAFTRTDIDNPVTREFCPDCGTHILTRSPRLPGVRLIKVGTMDDPAIFGQPEMAIYTCDAQAFHTVPEGIPSFEKGPG